jgi:hypothetical protein
MANVTDISLRDPPLRYKDLEKWLVKSLGDCKIVKDEFHFSRSRQAAPLWIWFERKTVLAHLFAGDTLYWGHVKLTRARVAKVIGASDGILAPSEELIKA